MYNLDFFYYMNGIRNQIKILKSKGLNFNDVKEAKEILKDEGFYNIINAFKPLFLDKNDNYISGANFDELYSIYLFDRNFRTLFLKYFLEFENNFKAFVSYEFSKKYGENSYLNYQNFDVSNTNIINSVSLVKEIYSIIYKNKDNEIISHYFYEDNKDIPLYALITLFSFGEIRYFYMNCKSDFKDAISNKYNLKPNELLSMLSLINMFRNVCAHNNRLIFYKVKDLNKRICNTDVHKKLNIETYPSINVNQYKKGKNDVFAVIIALKYLLSKDSFNSFYSELSNLISSLNSKINSIKIDEILDLMGFSKDNPNTGELDWKNIVKF